MKVEGFLAKNEIYPREELIKNLISIKYERNDYEFTKDFRVRGDVIEIFLLIKILLKSSIF